MQDPARRGSRLALRPDCTDPIGPSKRNSTTSSSVIRRRAEIVDGLTPPRRLGRGAHHPVVEIANVLVANAGPEALRDPMGAARSWSLPNVETLGLRRNQGFPYVAVGLPLAVSANRLGEGRPAHSQLAVDPGQVHLDGLRAEERALRDLAVGQPLGCEPGDPLLGRRQDFRPTGGPGSARARRARAPPRPGCAAPRTSPGPRAAPRGRDAFSRRRRRS